MKRIIFSLIVLSCIAALSVWAYSSSDEDAIASTPKEKKVTKLQSKPAKQPNLNKSIRIPDSSNQNLPATPIPNQKKRRELFRAWVRAVGQGDTPFAEEIERKLGTFDGLETNLAKALKECHARRIGNEADSNARIEKALIARLSNTGASATTFALISELDSLRPHAGDWLSNAKDVYLEKVDGQPLAIVESRGCLRFEEIAVNLLYDQIARVDDWSFDDLLSCVLTDRDDQVLAWFSEPWLSLFAARAFRSQNLSPESRTRLLSLGEKRTERLRYELHLLNNSTQTFVEFLELLRNPDANANKAAIREFLNRKENWRFLPLLLEYYSQLKGTVSLEHLSRTFPLSFLTGTFSEDQEILRALLYSSTFETNDEYVKMALVNIVRDGSVAANSTKYRFSLSVQRDQLTENIPTLFDGRGDEVTHALLNYAASSSREGSTGQPAGGASLWLIVSASSDFEHASKAIIEWFDVASKERKLDAMRNSASWLSALVYHHCAVALPDPKRSERIAAHSFLERLLQEFAHRVAEDGKSPVWAQQSLMMLDSIYAVHQFGKVHLSTKMISSLTALFNIYDLDRKEGSLSKQNERFHTFYEPVYLRIQELRKFLDDS